MDEEELEFEELDDELEYYEDPGITQTNSNDGRSTTREKVDEVLDGATSEYLQKNGIPKPLADYAAKNDGVAGSPARLPAFKNAKEMGRNTLANGIDKLSSLKNGKGSDVPKGLTPNKGPQNQSKANAMNRSNAEANENGGQGGKLGQSAQKGNEKEKSAVDNVKEQVVSKGLSAAAQAYGVPAPVADTLANKVAGPLLEMQKKKQKMMKMMIIGSVLGVFFLIMALLTIIAGDSDGESSSSSSKNAYLYGSGTKEDLYEYLEDKGYCDTVDSCEGTDAAVFYETLKDEISSNGNLTELEADVFITEFIFYDRSEEEMFAATEEIDYIANIIGEDGNFDIYDTDKFQEDFVADDGYLVTYRPDLLEDNDTKQSRIKIYNKLVKNAQSKSEVQVKGKGSSDTELSYGYNVNGKLVSNVKVRLLQCSDDKVGEPIAGEELIDFEKYVLGVVYAENGGGPAEALKAQAIAARTYALLRGDNMGNKNNLGLTQENGQWILSIRNCTEDQVYCDPDKGCWSNSKTADGTVHSGYDSSKAYSKQALPSNSAIRVAVADTTSKVLVGSSGKMINTPYSNKDQIAWNNSAKSGKDHFEILKGTYPTASKIISSGPSIAGDYTTWKQGGEVWSPISLGNSSYTIKSAGCLVTSVAMQIVKSGTTINANEFDPGVFVKHLNKNGGFTSGGNFYWNSPANSGITPNFIYIKQVSLTGSNSEKAAMIKSYQDQGYYIVIRAKTNQHWVSLDRVEGGQVYMFDPATNATKLFEKYTDNDLIALYVNNG